MLCAAARDFQRPQDRNSPCRPKLKVNRAIHPCFTKRRVRTQGEQPASRASIRTRARRRESHTERVEQKVELQTFSMAAWQNFTPVLDRALFFEY